MKGWTVLCLVVLVLSLSGLAGATPIAVVDSEYAEAFYANLGWDYYGMLDGVFDTIRAAGYTYKVIEHEDLTDPRFLSQFKLVILPDNRQLAIEAADGIREFVENGGKLLAAYQSSFRDRNNQMVSGGNYHLSDLFYVQYRTWSGSAPRHGYIAKATDHPIWKGLSEVRMGRNTAMVNEILPGGKIIGVWLNDDGVSYSNEEELNGAIFEGPNTIYIGESIFAPQNISDPDVEQLVINILRYLVG